MYTTAQNSFKGNCTLEPNSSNLAKVNKVEVYIKFVYVIVVLVITLTIVQQHDDTCTSTYFVRFCNFPSYLCSVCILKHSYLAFHFELFFTQVDNFPSNYKWILTEPFEILFFFQKLSVYTSITCNKTFSVPRPEQTLVKCLEAFLGRQEISQQTIHMVLFVYVFVHQFVILFKYYNF